MSEVIVRYFDNGYGNVSGEIVGELVRCKECRWHDHICWRIEASEREFMADDFCSYGEREGE